MLEAWPSRMCAPVELRHCLAASAVRRRQYVPTEVTAASALVHRVSEKASALRQEVNN
jgi:hypothetical protein